MTISIQKASFWKRISAYIFDFILAAILAVGFGAILSATVNYNSHLDRYNEIQMHYIEKYGLDTEITDEEYQKLTDEQKQPYIDADKELRADPEANKEMMLIMSLSLVVISVGVLLAVAVIYVTVPLLFKNGQTLGKKIFGLGVVRSNCVKISNPILIIRAVLGLYTIETMFPIMLILMMFFGLLGGIGTITIGLFFVLQTAVVAFTQNHTSIHDLLSDTVVVDITSQRIFESQDALIEYKQQAHAAEVAKPENPTQV